jgi:hypothetical protein
VQTIMILARTLPGCLKCSISVSQAFIADISTPQDRAKNLGEGPWGGDAV